MAGGVVVAAGAGVEAAGGVVVVAAGVEAAPGVELADGGVLGGTLPAFCKLWAYCAAVSEGTKVKVLS